LTPSKERIIFEGELAEKALGVRDCPQEDGSFKMLKTRAALVEKYAVATEAKEV
jgi:hypothetical protein